VAGASVVLIAALIVVILQLLFSLRGGSMREGGGIHGIVFGSIVHKPYGREVMGGAAGYVVVVVDNKANG
jgi:hypothetical protein